METKELTNETIAEIVTRDLRTARVFRKYGIDFCCGGKKKLTQVCSEKNIDVSLLEKDLLLVETEPRTTESNAENWEADFLADYIVNVHHSYVRHAIPDLMAWSEKVARVHGHGYPEVMEVHTLFAAAAAELQSHMMKEENILFPYIKNLCRMKREGVTNAGSPFGSVKNPIHVMEQEHEMVGEIFMKLEKITNNFTPPSEACNTYRALYRNLKDFEDDLFLHIHLENNILFHKAVALEKELSA